MTLDLTKAQKCKDDITKAYTQYNQVPRILNISTVAETDGSYRKIGLRTRVDLEWFNNPANIPIFDEFGMAIARGEIKYLIEQVTEFAQTSRKVDRNEIAPELLKDAMTTVFAEGGILLVPISIQYDLLLRDSRWRSFYDYQRNTFAVYVGSMIVPILDIHEDFIGNKMIGISRRFATWKARAFTESGGATIFAKVDVPDDDTAKVEIASWSLVKLEPTIASSAAVMHLLA